MSFFCIFAFVITFNNAKPMKSNLFLFFTLLMFVVGCTDNEEIHPVVPVDAGGEIEVSESVVTFTTGYSRYGEHRR